MSMTTKEIWEMTVPGRVWVQVEGERGRPRQQTVGGRVGARLRIATEDRILTQEAIMEPANDPFLNGTLLRVDVSQQNDATTRTVNAMTDEDVLALFALTGPDFEVRVRALGEVAMRRMLEAAEVVDASQSQVKFLRELVHERYAVGGDTPTYRELTGQPTGVS